MEFKTSLKLGFFLGKLGILAFLFCFLAYWIGHLIGGTSAWLIMGMIFSAFFLWVVK